jgi:hypothetical protein
VDQEQITILQAEELDKYLDELFGQMMKTSNHLNAK